MARKGIFYFAQSVYGMTATTNMVRMLAERHRDLPRIQSLLTMALDAEKELSEEAAQVASQGVADSPTPRPSDPPPAVQGVGLSGEQESGRDA